MTRTHFSRARVRAVVKIPHLHVLPSSAVSERVILITLTPDVMRIVTFNIEGDIRVYALYGWPIDIDRCFVH